MQLACATTRPTGKKGHQVVHIFGFVARGTKSFSQASFGEFLKEEYSHVNITSTSFSLWERSFGAA
jgi:hypothetical protein